MKIHISFIEVETIFKVFLNLCEQHTPVLVIILRIHLTDFPLLGISKHFWFAATPIIKYHTSHQQDIVIHEIKPTLK